MHELSIVMGIVGIAEKTLEGKAEKEVMEIELEIGELAGVDIHAFDFAWKTSIANTVLAQAKKTIRKSKGKALCLECQKEFSIQTVHDPCPICRQYFNKVLSGQELRVLSLTLN